ncbi:MAG: hypothetical protein AB7V32_02975 [Candidatus Berkiella sp.]
MWEILIAPQAVQTLKKLPKESSKSVFLFLNDYLPEDLSPSALAKAKVKLIKGIYILPKYTSKGMVHLFASIDFETHLIKVLHVIFFKKPTKRKSTRSKK